MCILYILNLVIFKMYYYYRWDTLGIKVERYAQVAVCYDIRLVKCCKLVPN